MVIKRIIRGMVLSVASILLLSACSNADQHHHSSQHQVQSRHEQTMHMHHDHQATQVNTQWQTTIQQANQEGEIHLSIKDDKGKPIPDFLVNHEQKMHLIAVSENRLGKIQLDTKGQNN